MERRIFHPSRKCTGRWETTTDVSASSRKVVVNGAADFTSVVVSQQLVCFHDGWKIRRSIHEQRRQAFPTSLLDCIVGGIFFLEHC